MAAFLSYVQSKFVNTKSICLMVVALCCVFPFIYSSYLGFTGNASAWQHVSENLLSSYLISSIQLVLCVAVGTFALGFASAFAIAFFDFPFKRFFQWALILPLSIPAYLLSFSYADMCSFTGWIRQYLGVEIDILNFKGAVFIFSMALYPYVYLPTLTFFKFQGGAIVEAAQSLGASIWRTIYTLLLPIARPAWFGGILLASMEVLNDYGVVKYYGVPSLTAGIFKVWFSLGDVQSALRLAGLVLLLVLLIVLLESFQRGKKRFNSRSNRSALVFPLPKYGKCLVFVCLSCLLLLAFLLPFFQLILGVINTAHKIIDAEFIQITYNSFSLAFVVSILSVCVAFTIEFLVRWNKNRHTDVFFSRTASVGYAIPGAVIAIGVLLPAQILDAYLANSLSLSFTFSTGLGLLIYGILVRLLAVSMQSIQTGFASLSPNLLEAAQIRGKSSFAIGLGLYMPMLKNFLASGFILVFIDVLKELPLTLILSPFNYRTLASKAFDLASDELLQESANPAIIIVLLGFIPVYLLNRILKFGTTQHT